MLKRKLLALTIAAVISGTSQAAVDINGFASIKGGMALSSDDELYGYDNDFSFTNESLAALQVKSDLGDKLSVTAQLLGRGAEDWDVEFEWAFLTYDLTDNLRINAGRLRTPFFKYSDYLDVGYAYDWSRVPQSVYDLGFNNLEGAAAIYTNTVGSYDSTLQISAGTLKDTLVIQSDIIESQLDNVTSISWELSQDTHSFRLVYLRGKSSVTGTMLDGFTSQLSGMGLNSLAQSIAVMDDLGWFMGGGFSLDKNNWVVVSEVTKSEVKDSYIGESLSYYLSIGHRFDTLTPYVSFEKNDNTPNTEIYSDLPMSSPVYASVTSLVNGQTLEQNHINVGVRYDFHPSAAFKAQYTNADNKTADRKDSVLVVGVDLVF